MLIWDKIAVIIDHYLLAIICGTPRINSYVKFTFSYFYCCLPGFESHKNVHCAWSQCMMGRFSTSHMRKHGGWCKTYFRSLKSVLAFQILMMSMLGKWATLARWLFCLDQSDFKRQYLISVVEHQKAQFGFLETCWWLMGLSRLYDAGQSPAGKHAGYFKVAQ